MSRAPIRLDGEGFTLVLSGDPVPGVLHLGPALPPNEDLAALAAARHQPAHGSQPDECSVASIFPCDDLTRPALVARRGGAPVGPAFVCRAVTADANGVTIDLEDAAGRIDVVIRCEAVGRSLVWRSRLLNRGGPLEIAVLSAIVLPVPAVLGTMTRFAGRWAGEMQVRTAPIPPGETAAESREGRPGFAGAHWLILQEPDAGLDHGRMIGIHVATNGDAWWRVVRDADGTTLAAGSRLDPGEIVVPPGGAYDAPAVVLHLTDAGRNGLRRASHAHVRTDVLPLRAGWPPRRVHLNSWEALGFDLDEARAMALADAAVAIGAERFVLDDGWFLGRTSDRKGLGDWTPDPIRFPHGLGPLITHVQALGMDFGLWVEPEMISPDSDLYRAHPDWCLHADRGRRLTQRHQLVLDLTHPDAFAHVAEVLDGLLRTNAIAYIKWDHNRPLFPRIAEAQAQAAAVLALMDRVRARHPVVEIEACASGGGRVDHLTLARAHRFWPSDNNDPHDRAAIDSAWSLFLPPEIRGAHVGPAPNPITGRRASMQLRAALAIFGHMGVEADPAAMTDGERDVLSAAIALHKAWRGVLHTGVERELPAPPGGFARLIQSEDGARGLAIAACLESPAGYNAPPVRLTGLPADRRYRVTLPDPRPRRGRDLDDLGGWRTGRILSGQALADGIVLPLQRPETAWLIELEAIA